MDEKGDIYARGSQDMKCVGIQYLEAIRRLKTMNKRCKRTIHVSFMPEEEVGGVSGMKDFIHTKEYQSLNIGFALDEGIASPSENYHVFYGERCIWHVKIHCEGYPGHGSLLIDNTAADKFYSVLGKFMDFRMQQKQRLNNENQSLGNVTSVNLTKIQVR